MAGAHVLLGAIVAVASSYALLRTVRAMTADAFDIASGGGWAALLLLEIGVGLAAAAVAIS